MKFNVGDEVRLIPNAGIYSDWIAHQDEVGILTDVNHLGGTFDCAMEWKDKSTSLAPYDKIRLAKVESWRKRICN